MPAPIDLLPTHLAERVARDAAGLRIAASGRYVLYWARTAVRGHENPALDTACALGIALQLPVFVYHALSERYPYASDRHHMFILEGARDFARELRAAGISTAFHLEREGHRGPHLQTLAADAAIVITELMPVAPLVAWTAAVQAGTTAPVWQVDTSCVVPVTLTTQAWDRAFAYRDATARLRRERVGRPWPTQPVPAPAGDIALPFTPVDLDTADFATLIASCRIDHGVGPVRDTRGGSVAGYARWTDFVDSGRLDRYDRLRNDPTRPDGVSRMSAYLHYGMVSPFRLAREAAARPGEGAAKWLDELLVWRELGYTFCHHRPDHGTVSALPPWARDTLRAHEADHRELLDWERLARGRTGSAFWNAMQHSLLAHGELHNNVRMTWGKAFAGWTPDAARALALSIDLNHRYALDGRDPASYSGLLWCLGQFDRPFTPENRIHGTVRGRAVSDQAARINVPKYAQHVRRGPSVRVAVVGAGLAGLTCARTLFDHNIAVTVFEKSRGLGGRCATRRDGPWQFDHGAQYFTVRDARLAPLIHSWHERGIVTPWAGALAVVNGGVWTPAKTGVRRWIAVPGMSALGAHLAEDLDVQRNQTVSGLARDGAGWRLRDAEGVDLGTFDIVLTCIPAPQAIALLGDAAPQIAAHAATAVMHPTWATMVVLQDRLDVSYDGAFLNDHASLGWISRDASKPSRSAQDTWVLHANRDWSTSHLEDDAEHVALELTSAFTALCNVSSPVVHARAHRWRFALPDPVTDSPALFDGRLGLGAGGDWCGGPRIEGALLSGSALAGRVLCHIHLTMTDPATHPTDLFS